MTKKNKPRRKHQPQRTCIGCRTVQNKRTLIRIVRTSEGVQIDPSGKLPGRGAYLHESHTCWEKGLKGQLALSLKTELNDRDKKRLHEFMDTFQEEDQIQFHEE